MGAENFPDFFDQAPRIVLYDPLADFLGAARAGILEYRYADAVRLAGHSCPTVASAFLMTRAALAALYPGELPRRGEIRVAFALRRDEGVTGVIANVAGLITGATEDAGFQGIGGRFNRRGLLAFGQPVTADIAFRRADSGVGVQVRARLERLIGDPRMPQLMPLCLAGQASNEQGALFRRLWQERVRRLLLEHADDRDIIETAPIID